MKNVREVLLEVRDLFQSTHWAQGDWMGFDEEKDKATYCLVGGLRLIISGNANEEPGSEEEYGLYDEVVRQLTGVLVESGRIDRIDQDELADYSAGMLADKLVGFNDSVNTKLDDVLALLDTASGKVPA